MFEEEPVGDKERVGEGEPVGEREVGLEMLPGEEGIIAVGTIVLK